LPRVKRSEHVVHHWTPSGAEAKSECDCISPPPSPCITSWCAHGQPFLFLTSYAASKLSSCTRRITRTFCVSRHTGMQ
jgi:hypothetical protein